ncbi:MAG: hypothetical protein WB586_00125 [Chthoniobacterales bacterium]
MKKCGKKCAGLAHFQIDAKIKGDLEKLERDSAQVQLDILSNGFVTEAVKEFFQRLPKVDELIPPLKIEDVKALMDGSSPGQQGYLPEWKRPALTNSLQLDRRLQARLRRTLPK